MASPTRRSRGAGTPSQSTRTTESLSAPRILRVQPRASAPYAAGISMPLAAHGPTALILRQSLNAPATFGKCFALPMGEAFAAFIKIARYGREIRSPSGATLGGPKDLPIVAGAFMPRRRATTCRVETP